jgi:sugar phosphate isomerase/epimerase
LTAFSGSHGSSMAQWHAKLASANAHAERCRRRGIDFVLHTQPELWESIEDRRPIDLLPAALDRALVSLEYDPSGAIMYGVDPLVLLTEWHDSFHAVHLRDGYTPPKPVAYLPALPLGRGGIDWLAFVSASRDAAVQWYFLEMEVTDPTETLPALSRSLEHLAARGMPLSS